MTEPNPLHRVASAEDEKAASRRLTTVLAPRIDALTERHHTRRPVAPGSPLYGDDLAAEPYHLSHAAWHPISHAIDNLHALRSLTVRGDLPNLTVHIHPYSAYPLIRAAYENASQAVWLLGDPNRNVRLTRRFRLLLTDDGNSDKVAELTGSGPGTARAARLAKVQPIAQRRGLENWAKFVGFGEMVGGAAKVVGRGPDGAKAIWHVLSGLTHGDMWASLATTDRDEIEVSEDGNMVTFRTTSSITNVTNVANLTDIAVTATEHAVRLYDLRCTPIG